MLTKRIIKRNLPLDRKYILIDTKYISILDGYGCTCDNCGKLIANIATVKSDDNTFQIGFDCLETFLINNLLLDDKDIEQYNKAKKSLPKIKKIKEDIKTFMEKNPFIDTVEILEQSMFDNWIVFQYYQNGKMRWNDGIKVKSLDIEMLITSLKTLKNITICHQKN